MKFGGSGYELDGWDRFVFTVSFCLTMVAATVRLRESRSGSWREFRWIHRTIGILAAAYGVGYLAVLFGFMDRLAWSRFFTGVSLFAWVIVWIYPPILARRVARDIVEQTAVALTKVPPGV